jgi:hypothetical protein
MTRPPCNDWLFAVCIGLLVSLSWDLDADTLASATTTDAQRTAAAEARKERAAAQLCIKLHGPGVAHGWTPDGARRGPARTVVAGGAL